MFAFLCRRHLFMWLNHLVWTERNFRATNKLKRTDSIIIVEMSHKLVKALSIVYYSLFLREKNVVVFQRNFTCITSEEFVLT